MLKLNALVYAMCTYLHDYFAFLRKSMEITHKDIE